jgi:hypothetical protein
MPSASIISDFQRSSSNSSLSSSLLLAACQQPYDINDLSYCFDQQQKLSSPPPSLLYDSMGKKSQNMTECVPVPSSEHVAEIVGRQGKQTSHQTFPNNQLVFFIQVVKSKHFVQKRIHTSKLLFEVINPYSS